MQDKEAYWGILKFLSAVFYVENIPQRLMCWDTWSPAGSAQLEDFGASLEKKKSRLMGMDLEVFRPDLLPDCSVSGLVRRYDRQPYNHTVMPPQPEWAAPLLNLYLRETWGQKREKH